MIFVVACGGGRGFWVGFWWWEGVSPWVSWWVVVGGVRLRRRRWLLASAAMVTSFGGGVTILEGRSEKKRMGERKRRERGEKVRVCNIN